MICCLKLINVQRKSFEEISLTKNVSAPFGVKVPGNPTWGELAAQNPELLKQLTDSGLANQPVLTAASQPGKNECMCTLHRSMQDF